MNNIFFRTVLIFTSIVLLFSCEKNNTSSNNLFDNGDREEFQSDDINAFIYYGLSASYLYKDEQPLFNQEFESVNEEDDPKLSPEAFFEKMIVAEDRFSFIVDDFEALENSFAGINLSDGIDFRLSRIDNGSELIGYVYYVDKNSAGELAGVQRGDFFTTINGEILTDGNYRDILIDANTYDVELLTYNAETEDFDFRTTTTVGKFEYQEDPILVSKVIDYEGLRIGYLMYNSFIAGSENQLNEEFAQFAAAGIDELVLDLRYNGGGRVSTAVDLSGMITGQFAGDVLITEQWNSELQARFEEEDPELLRTRFRSSLTDGSAPLNSLNLDRVYVLSSKDRTASASELVINGLDAHINVIHVGDESGTVGKSQASTTIYDSPDLGRENATEAHKYALQPLIFRSANGDGVSVPNEGITPDTFYTESIFNLGVLGEVDEPLLQTALNTITGVTIAAKNISSSKMVIGNSIINSKEENIDYQRMYK